MALYPLREKNCYLLSVTFFFFISEWNRAYSAALPGFWGGFSGIRRFFAWLLADAEGHALVAGTVAQGGEQLAEGLAAVDEMAGGGATTYQDAAGGVGSAVAGVDADALEVGDILQQRQGATEPGGVGQHHGIGAGGDGGLAVDLLLGAHGGGTEVAVGGLQGVAEGLSVDGEATHGVAVASLGAL